MRRLLGEHKGLGACLRAGPIAYVLWLAQCRTTADCSDPIAASIPVALVVVLRMELVGQLAWAPVRMAAVEGSLGVGNPELAVGSLGLEAGIHILLVVHPAASSLGLEVVVGLEPGHLVHFVHSSHRKARGHQEQHRLGHHHTMAGEKLEAHLLEYLRELFWSSLLRYAPCLPVGFLSSSSSNSFIFFLRKSMVPGYYSAKAE